MDLLPRGDSRISEGATFQHRYVFFVTQAYSFGILQPLETEMKQSGLGEVRWFTAGRASAQDSPGKQLNSTNDVLEFDPSAVIIPGNVVPHYWPGLKVQVFHGLDEEAKGYYRITGFFDLYCTAGPYTTRRFTSLAARHKTFMVAQTGWPKLDPFADRVDLKKGKHDLELDPQSPVILYAPTFPRKYTSASDLFHAIKHIGKDSWQWLVKFHPMMDRKVVDSYRSMETEDFRVVPDHNVLPLMQAADLLITDTSSVAYEFLPFDRPIITFRALARKDKGIDIERPEDLGAAVERALANPGEFSENRQAYLKELHPYSDGQSSLRVIQSIENVLRNNLHLQLKKKPLNLVRRWQVRRLVR